MTVRGTGYTHVRGIELRRRELVEADGTEHGLDGLSTRGWYSLMVYWDNSGSTASNQRSRSSATLPA